MDSSRVSVAKISGPPTDHISLVTFVGSLIGYWSSRPVSAPSGLPWCRRTGGTEPFSKASVSFLGFDSMPISLPHFIVLLWVSCNEERARNIFHSTSPLVECKQMGFLLLLSCGSFCLTYWPDIVLNAFTVFTLGFSLDPRGQFLMFCLLANSYRIQNHFQSIRCSLLLYYSYWPLMTCSK